MTARGATRLSDIDAHHLHELNTGLTEARTLTEALAIDQSMLFRHVIADAPAALSEVVSAATKAGILKKMSAIGAALQEHLPEEEVHLLSQHPSDTVRGWTAFAYGAETGTDLVLLLERLSPLADDPNFSVREWAWMAARPRLTEDLPHAITLLTPWTLQDSERLRRFASEALRPRGVWARHIKELKADPDLGLPLLEPLRSDISRYVQDSVANWINDAAKSKPNWALGLCARWEKESPTPQTDRIIRRALRSVGEQTETR